MICSKRSPSRVIPKRVKFKREVSDESARTPHYPSHTYPAARGSSRADTMKRKLSTTKLNKEVLPASIARAYRLLSSATASISTRHEGASSFTSRLSPADIVEPSQGEGGCSLCSCRSFTLWLIAQSYSLIILTSTATTPEPSSRTIRGLISISERQER